MMAAAKGCHCVPPTAGDALILRQAQDGDGPGFVAIAPFRIDDLNAGKRHGRGASRLDRLIQIGWFPRAFARLRRGRLLS
jgi:hypothetical protein